MLTEETVGIQTEAKVEMLVEGVFLSERENGKSSSLEDNANLKKCEKEGSQLIGR